MRMYETIAEKDFLGLLGPECRPFVGLKPALKGTKSVSVYNHVSCVSDSLENFLDDYGASENSTFRYFRELVASVRNFSSIAYTANHVLNRLNAYGLQTSSAQQLRADIKIALDYFADITMSLHSESLKELAAIGIDCLKPVKAVPVSEYVPKLRLPFTVELSDTEKEEGYIQQMAIYYKDVIAQSKDVIACHLSGRSLHEIAQFKIDESICEKLKSQMKRIESCYDTHVKGTKKESGDDTLNQFRGIVACTSHLYGIAEGLMHFYERHENEMRHGDSKDMIASIVRRDTLLEVAINNIWKNAYDLILKGKDVSEYICEIYAKFEKREIVLNDMLHARPASFLCKMGGHYSAKGKSLEMLMPDGQFYKIGYGSVLTLLSAGLSMGKSVTFRGPKEVLDDLALLNSLSFGARSTGSFPQQLDYLNQK